MKESNVSKTKDTEGEEAWTPKNSNESLLAQIPQGLPKETLENSSVKIWEERSTA